MTTTFPFTTSTGANGAYVFWANEPVLHPSMVLFLDLWDHLDQVMVKAAEGTLVIEKSSWKLDNTPVDSPGCGLLGLPVPVKRVPQVIPHFQRQPPGPRIGTTIATRDLVSTAENTVHHELMSPEDPTHYQPSPLSLPKCSRHMDGLSSEGGEHLPCKLQPGRNRPSTAGQHAD